MNVYRKSKGANLSKERGADMHTSRKALDVKIDWISIVFEGITSNQICHDILGIPNTFFHEVEKGVKHKDYDVCLEFGGIQIFINRQKNRDINLAECYFNASGEGCNQLYNILTNQNIDWFDFFIRCFSCCKEFHLTRLDIAIDDRNEKPFFTIEQLYKKCLKNHYLATSRKYEYKEKTFSEGGTQKILYIGSKSSDKLIRFYDKDKEQAEKFQKPLKKIGSWKRTEIQLRTKVAHNFMYHLISHYSSLSKLTFDFLSTHIQFLVENPNEPNKENWATCRFWERFLGSVTPLKVKVTRKKTSLAETEKWMLFGGVIPVILAFEFLEQHNALGELKSLQKMKNEVCISRDLCSKIVAHLSQIEREDCIPLIYNEVKRGTA